MNFSRSSVHTTAPSMDIRSLIGPPNVGVDAPDTSEQASNPESQSSAQDASCSPAPSSSPASRRQTVSSLLNDDSSDYLQGRSERTVDTSKPQVSPTLTSREVSSPIDDRSQSPLSTRPLRDSPDQRVRSNHSSPSITKRALLLDEITSPKTASAVSGVFSSARPAQHSSAFASRRSKSTSQDDPLTTHNSNEEGNSSPPATSGETREEDSGIGHLPSKAVHHSTGLGTGSSPTTNEHPQRVPSLPPPLKAQPSISPGTERSTMQPVKELNGNGHINGEIDEKENPKVAPTKAFPTLTVKPKRYDEPPIWALSYRKLNNLRMIQTRTQGPLRHGDYQRQQASHRTNRPLHYQPHQQAHHASQKSQASRATTLSQIPSMSGLPVSLTDVLPYEDLTRKITEWLFATLHNLGDERQYVEVEVKLGQIMQRKIDKRLNLPVTTETVVSPDYARTQTFFQASMLEQQFKAAAAFLDALASESKGTDKPTRIVSYPVNSTRDLVFQPPGADNCRVTLNKEDQEIERIIKRRVDNLVVHSPGDLLDFRISISLELPVTGADIDLTQLAVKTERVKNRLSYVHRAFQVDLTSVVTDKVNNTQELEVEINKPLMLEYFDALSRGEKDASLRFEELIRFTLDNTRLILRKISR